jgi:hypothetical protein
VAYADSVHDRIPQKLVSLKSFETLSVTSQEHVPTVFMTDCIPQQLLSPKSFEKFLATSQWHMPTVFMTAFLNNWYHSRLSRLSQLPLTYADSTAQHNSCLGVPLNSKRHPSPSKTPRYQCHKLSFHHSSTSSLLTFMLTHKGLIITGISSHSIMTRLPPQPEAPMLYYKGLIISGISFSFHHDSSTSLTPHLTPHLSC